MSAPPRIWVAHCPFRKTGSPVLGSMGSTIREVVVMELSTWNRLVDEHPSLAEADFEVGSAS